MKVQLCQITTDARPEHHCRCKLGEKGFKRTPAIPVISVQLQYPWSRRLADGYSKSCTNKLPRIHSDSKLESGEEIGRVLPVGLVKTEKTNPRVVASVVSDEQCETDDEEIKQRKDKTLRHSLRS